MIKGEKMDWKLYENSLTVKGNTRRERAIFETRRSVNKRVQRSPAYKSVLIDGAEQNVVITSSTEKYHKKINAVPGEHIYAGSIVSWNNAHFLITNTDVEDEIYQSGDMYQCNIFLKWQNEKGEIISRYGYSEDISQFASGEVESKVMMSIEQVFVVKFPCDSETVKLRRDKRFLIDICSDEPGAYVLTGRNVLSGNWTAGDITGKEFDGKGKVLTLTFSQTQLSDKDNKELMIADYFNPDDIGEKTVTEGVCSISYSGEPSVRVGGSYKTFTAHFTDTGGNEIPAEAHWKITAVTPEYEKNFNSITSGNKIKIKADNILSMIGSQFLLEVYDENETMSAKIFVKVVSLYG